MLANVERPLEHTRFNMPSGQFRRSDIAFIFLELRTRIPPSEGEEEHDAGTQSDQEQFLEMEGPSSTINPTGVAQPVPG